MSLRIRLPKIENSEQRKPVLMYPIPDDLPFYIRPLTNKRPKSPFRKYEQCIRNSFKQRNYSNYSPLKMRHSSQPPSKQCPTEQSSSSPHQQLFRTDLTINLTRMPKLTALRSLSPLSTRIAQEAPNSTRPSQSAETKEEKKFQISAELLLLKINEMAAKKKSKTPLDREPSAQSTTMRPTINNKNKAINQKQLPPPSNKTGLLYFRDSAFLIELINHPIVKKQTKSASSDNSKTHSF